MSRPANDRFDRAAEELASGGSVDLCSAIVGALPVAGAAISTLGAPLGSQTVCASDRIAARIDEIQIDLGQGPCWEALRDRRPVLTDDVRGSEHDRWPVARTQFASLDIVGLYAFPLTVGHIPVGCLDLYSIAAGSLSRTEIEGAVGLAEIAARQVLRRAIDALDDEPGAPPGPYSRREVHQAVGMVAAQLRIDVDDAELVLRAHAFASGASVRDVASEVIARRMDFSP